MIIFYIFPIYLLTGWRYTIYNSYSFYIKLCLSKIQTASCNTLFTIVENFLNSVKDRSLWKVDEQGPNGLKGWRDRPHKIGTSYLLQGMSSTGEENSFKWTMRFVPWSERGWRTHAVWTKGSHQRRINTWGGRKWWTVVQFWLRREDDYFSVERPVFAAWWLKEKFAETSVKEPLACLHPSISLAVPVSTPKWYRPSQKHLPRLAKVSIVLFFLLYVI